VSTGIANQYAALLLSYFLAINAPFLIALSTTREISIFYIFYLFDN